MLDLILGMRREVKCAETVIQDQIGQDGDNCRLAIPMMPRQAAWRGLECQPLLHMSLLSATGRCHVDAAGWI
jgi:hypothetical protein